MKTKSILSFAVIATAVAFSSASFAGDAAKGEAYFKKKCKACHTFEAGKGGKTGPNLMGFMSRPAGTGDFKYSKNMKDAGFTWDAAKLDEWLTNPKKMIKKSRMVLKVKKAKDRENVIAYIMEAGK